MVEGFYNPAHVIRTFIAKEYAFSYFFEDREIRVAHHKGQWTCAKIIKESGATDWFAWDDCGSGVQSYNELTQSLAEAIMHQNSGELAKNPTRGAESEILWKMLEIWGGKAKNVLKITVVQPGRNASIDESTLEFVLNPREEEFYA